MPCDGIACESGGLICAISKGQIMLGMILPESRIKLPADAPCALNCCDPRLRRIYSRCDNRLQYLKLRLIKGRQSTTFENDKG